MLNKIFNAPKTRFAMLFQISTIALVSFALPRTSFLLLIPCTSFFFLNQSQHDVSNNHYINEMASNGAYPLFVAAFRNNTLDYQPFYKTGNDKTLSDLLKKEIGGQNSKNHNKDLHT